MHNVELYIFSGTGNTLKAATYMQNALSAKSVKCTLFGIDANTDSSAISPTQTLGIGFPIACFSTYPLVWDFILNLPVTTVGTEIFLFSTFASSDGNVCAQLVPVLETKGYNVIGYEGFIMPSNFKVKRIDKAANDKLFAICERRATEFISRMLVGEKFTYSGRLMSKLYKCLYNFFFSSGRIQKLIKLELYTEKCNGCGICTKACPTGNITIEDKHAVFSNKCQICMRCSGFCPEGAIRLKNSRPYSCYNYTDFIAQFAQQPID